MRIAVLAHPRYPIRPPFAGGIEAHTWHLTRGLIQRGHEVTLLAAGDSDPDLPVTPLIAEHYEISMPWATHTGTPELNRVLDNAFASAGESLARSKFDVVHNNSLHRFPPRMARRDRFPMVTSLHVPPFYPLSAAVCDGAAPWSRVTTTSRWHMTSYGGLTHAHVVPNGIDPSLWPWCPSGNGSAVWVGRICPNKGTHLAVNAALIAGVPLTIYGTVEDRAYYETAVAPYLGKAIRYAGVLSGNDLAGAVGQASVLLFTPCWDEPFGLVAIEAMSCGVPIAATDRGAVREVVGEGGIVAPPDDPHALATALLRATGIPRDRPRKRVLEHFTQTRMLEAYEDVYRIAIESREDPFPFPDYAPIACPAPAAG